MFFVIQKLLLLLLYNIIYGIRLREYVRKFGRVETNLDTGA